MEDGPLITIGLPVALFIIMVGIGLTLTAADFRREATRPAGLVVGSVGQLLLMPLLGFAIVLLFGLEGPIAVGVVIAAAVPGGATSNLITYLGRGNVPLSIVMTASASLVTVLTLPVVTELALGQQGLDAEGVQLPVIDTIGRLVAIVLLPVVIGMVLRAKAPGVAAKGERAVSAFGAVVLIGLIVGIAIGLWEDIPTFLRQAGPAVVALNLGGIALGFLLSAGARLPFADRFAVAVELGVKNSTLGILIGGTLLGSFAYAVPSAVYGLLMYVSAGALVAFGRRRTAADAPGRSTPVP